MNKALIYAVGILLALTVALGFGLSHQLKANGAQKVLLKAATDELEQAAVQRKKDADLLARLTKEKRAVALQSRTDKEALKQATKEAEEWAATATPTPVQKALSEALERPE